MDSVFVSSFNLIKDKKVKEAKDVFLKNSQSLSDDDFSRIMLAFKKGHSLMVSGYYQEAVEYFEKSQRLLGLTKDKYFELMASSFFSFCKGVVLLWSGDSFLAEEEIVKAKEGFKKLIFSLPELEDELLNMEATISTVKAKKYLSIGDLNGFEKFSGEARSYYQRIVKNLELKGGKNEKALAVAYASEVENCLAIVRSLIDKFDFEKALKSLEDSEINHLKLVEYKDDVNDESLRRVLNVMCLLFETYKTLMTCFDKLYVKGRKADVKDFSSLNAVENLCMNARNEANLAGDRGQIFIYSIEQLEKIALNVKTFQKFTKKDFGRLSGIFSLITFVFLAIVLKIFIFKGEAYPSEFLWLQVIFSLIVGFGYGALKFIPMLKVIKD